MNKMRILDLDFLNVESVTRVTGANRPTPLYSVTYSAIYDTDRNASRSSNYVVERRSRSYAAGWDGGTAAAVGTAVAGAVVVGGTTSVFTQVAVGAR